jgi:hypothetical protein
MKNKLKLKNILKPFLGSASFAKNHIKKMIVIFNLANESYHYCEEKKAVPLINNVQVYYAIVTI